MRKMNFTTLLIMAVMISGCSKSAPECSDQKSIDLVKQIYKRELEASAPGSKVEFEIEGIRTTAKDDKTGAQSCAADIIIKLSGTNYVNKTSFTFKSELTDKGEHYVSIK